MSNEGSGAGDSYAKGYSQALADVAKGGHNSAFARDHGLKLVPIRESVSQADIREGVCAEMLAALRECVKQLDAIIDDGIPTDWRMWRDDINAVIAKATAV